MIAKPDMPEDVIRVKISAIDEIIFADAFPSMRKLWQSQRREYEEMLEKWSEYRRSAAVARALHQRPSVRRHITRRVKTPA